MPIRRRRTTRRRRTLRPRRRRTVRRVKRNPYNSSALHMYKRYTCVTNMTLFPVAASVGSLTKTNGYIIPTTTAATATPAYYSFAVAFCLADIPSYSEFTNLYDHYRINGVALRFTPVFTDVPQSSTAATSNTGAMMHMIYDFDDLTVPGTNEAAVDTLREYPTYKTYNLASNRTFKKYIRPKLQTVVYGSGAFGVRTEVKGRPWIDANDVNANYFGLKGIIELYQLNANISYFPIKVEATYYLAFKNPR